MNIDKPWGSELVLYKFKEGQVKILKVKAGHRTSLQRHKTKQEVMMLLTGECLFEGIGNPRKMVAGKMYVIEPTTVHRVSAVTDTEILEMSSGEDADIERLHDDYKRGVK